jgi:hypothetical protein
MGGRIAIAFSPIFASGDEIILMINNYCTNRDFPSFPRRFGDRESLIHPVAMLLIGNVINRR